MDCLDRSGSASGVVMRKSAVKKRKYVRRRAGAVQRDALLAFDPVEAWLAGFSWQPISSAPRDGTCVLLRYAKEEITAVGSFSVRSDGSAAWIISRNPLVAAQLTATHWMPLPMPPKVDS